LKIERQSLRKIIVCPDYRNKSWAKLKHWAKNFVCVWCDNDRLSEWNSKK